MSKPEFLLVPILVLGLHCKYIYLRYDGSGGFAGYWRGWRGDNQLKKLTKIGLLVAIASSLLAATGAFFSVFVGLAMAALITHLLALTLT